MALEEAPGRSPGAARMQCSELCRVRGIVAERRAGMGGTNFQGLTVLTLESRRGQEMGRLIETYGGKAVHAAAMREVPLSSNVDALKFADALFEGKFDVVVFLTGVGARALSKVLEGVHPTERFVEALRKVSVIARG